MSGQPASTVQLRNDLHDLMEEIKFEELELTAGIIAPEVLVQKETARYPVLPREAVMKVPNTRRHPDGSYPEGQWEWSDAPYECYEYGFQMRVDNVNKLRYADFIDMEETSSRLAYQSLMLARESRVATALYNATTFNGKTAGVSNEWDDATNAAPWADIETASLVITKASGLHKQWQSLILSPDLVEYALRTNEIKNYSQYTDLILTKPFETKKKFFAEYLGIKEVITVRSLYDTTGLASEANIGKFWSNEYSVLGVLCGPGAKISTRGLIKAPVWEVYTPDYKVESYSDNVKNSEVVRVSEDRGLIIDTTYGYLLSNMKTSVDSSGF